MANKKFIGKKFQAIHRARELAIQFLFSLEVNQYEDLNTAIELFMNNEELTSGDTPEVKMHSREIIGQVITRKNEIDSFLLRIVTGWRPERMVIVDRIILRLMVLEGFMLKSLPVKSAISEANKLANSFGTRDSSRFINGVMVKAAKFFAQREIFN